MKKYPNISILLIEDDMLNQQVVKMLLTNMGCDVAIAGTGHSALDAFKAKPYDLILMDYEMPDINGPEIATRLRALENEIHAGKHVPIINLSAHQMGEKRIALEQAGVDDFISKPLTLEKLETTLRRWLS
jgi:CheY-like chemotaxis protein